MPVPAVPKLACPIVLVHGLCGYDRITALGRPLKDYFPGIRQQLEAAGNRVLVPRLSCTQGVADRAAELGRYLDRHAPPGPVHLIGHSMGGLDSRYLVSRIGMAGRVRSVTTVGTPHRGSPVADWGVRRFGALVAPLFQLLGLSTRAFLDLTSAACARFNAAARDVPGVRYFAVAGACDESLLSGGWRLPHELVSRAEGANDGVVSVASAEWGEHTEVWPGDHLNLVNWPNRPARRRGAWEDIAPDYGRILRRIAATE